MNDDLDKRCIGLIVSGFDYMIEEARANVLVAAMASLDECESPIEKLMCSALTFGLHRAGLGVRPMSAFYSPAPEDGLWVQPQLQIGAYRVDFAVTVSQRWADDLVVSAQVVIECDGHDFHERTPEQAERDRSRDRALTALGWTVLRFTGREIVRSPEHCVSSVIDVIRAEFDRQGRRVLLPPAPVASATPDWREVAREAVERESGGDME